MATALDSDITHCMDMVRINDRARYMTTLYAPDGARPKLWALHAFNIELSRVREQVSEAMLGEIRLAWWREAVEGIYAGQPRKHPVVAAMVGLQDDVPRPLLESMIDGRMTDVYDGALADFAALMLYARQTAGAHNAAAAHVLGVPEAAAVAVAENVGTAWGLTGILRAVQFHALHQQVYLPDEDLQALGLTREALVQQPVSDAIIPLVRRIARTASELLGAPARTVPPACLLLGTLARDYMQQLARAGYDVAKADFQQGDLRRQAKLAWASLTGRY
jgi:NADH dehydrogenase [ubiquinone] 1 alpha subcomplex assembly factor 6